MIRKLKSGQYRLYSKKKDPKTGKRRNLGTFKTRAAAQKHEKAVQYFKRAWAFLASVAPEAVRYRLASTADADAMAQCRRTDPAVGAELRTAAYLDGKHHPQQALLPRVAFVGLDDDVVIGYIAGHLTRRFGCDGELQYLFVAPSHRRHKVAAEMLRLLALWFVEQRALRVCVNADIDSPGAVPFYVSQGAVALNPHWYVWNDIRSVMQ
jgi:GNAT superfamily N-acetyltransferase